MELETKKLEGKIDNLEATSASDEIEGENDAPVVEEPTPELNSTPVPTQEDKENAGLNTDVPVEETPEAPVSDTPEIPAENVNDSVPVMEENGVTETPALRTYTQEEYQNGLNEIAGKVRMETREKTFRYIYDRYGVDSEEALDEMIGNSQRFESLREEYDGAKNDWKIQSSARDKELADIKEQVALMQSGIDASRYEDAKFIIKGKGLEITTETINNELSTHPEWKKDYNVNSNPNFMKVDETKPLNNPEPASKISVLGNDNAPSTENETEEDRVLKRMFKI